MLAHAHRPPVARRGRPGASPTRPRRARAPSRLAPTERHAPPSRPAKPYPASSRSPARRHPVRAGARGRCSGTPDSRQPDGSAGVHHAVHALVRRRLAAAPRAAAGHLGAEGERPRRDRPAPRRTSPWSPASGRSCRWSATRSSAGSATAPRADGDATPVDAPRSGGRNGRHPDRRPGPDIAVVLAGWCIARCSSTRCSPPRPQCCPTRSRASAGGRCPGSSASACRWRPWPAPTSCRHSTASSSPCSWRRARSAAVRRACSPRGSTTAASTPPIGHHGRCARSPARSTSTRDATPTSPGRSSAGSCW